MLTKGQKAMAWAKLYPETGEIGAGRGNKSEDSSDFASRRYLNMARTILKHTPAMADEVLIGAEPFDPAYKAALVERDRPVSTEGQLADLRARYPELADKVVEGDLTLPGAQAEAKERRRNCRAIHTSDWGHTGVRAVGADIVVLDASFHNTRIPSTARAKQYGMAVTATAIAAVAASCGAPFADDTPTTSINTLTKAARIVITQQMYVIAMIPSPSSVTVERRLMAMDTINH